MTIKGKNIYLVNLRKDTYEYFYNWFSDKGAVKYSLSKWQKKHTKEHIRQWLENTLRDKKVVNFGIIESSTYKIIGYAGIKGYGTEVTKLVINYGFKKLKLHRISLTVSEPNIGGVKAYTRAGFKKEGILRDAAFRDGKFHNKLVMFILDSEWEL